MILRIAKINEEAEKKAEEQEKRWLESEDRREKERREHKDRHAQMMMPMFSGFMTQLGGMMMHQPLVPSRPSHMFIHFTAILLILHSLAKTLYLITDVKP